MHRRLFLKITAALAAIPLGPIEVSDGGNTLPPSTSRLALDHVEGGIRPKYEALGRRNPKVERWELFRPTYEGLGRWGSSAMDRWVRESVHYSHSQYSGWVARWHPDPSLRTWELAGPAQEDEYLWILVFGADEPEAVKAALDWVAVRHPVEHPVVEAPLEWGSAWDRGGALVGYAVVLLPHDAYWPEYAADPRLRQLARHLRGVILQRRAPPGGPAAQLGSVDPVQELLRFFTMEPGLVGYDYLDILYLTQHPGLWVSHLSRCPGRAAGGDPARAAYQVLCQLGVPEPTAVIARWQSNWVGLTLDGFDAIGEGIMRYLGDGKAGRCVFTCTLDWTIKDVRDDRLLMLSRVG